MLRKVLKEVDVSGATMRPSDLQYLIGHWKTHSVSPSAAAAQAVSDRDHLAAACYRRYALKLKSLGAVDFDDLLLLTEQLFAKHAAVRREEAARFDQILIDEYQDTNASQYRIVKCLAAGHRNLCVVGDDDQSIYGWRGAEVAHILRFKQDWPEAKVVRLEDNYRSTAPILQLANRLIQHNATRHPKQLRASLSGGERPRILRCKDEVAEAKTVVTDIKQMLRQQDTQPRDIAILFRTNEQPRTFETELRRENIPYVIVGSMSFFDRKEVRDVLAFIKVLDDPHDDPSLLRIVNVPKRGVGEKAMAVLSTRAAQQRTSVWEVVKQARGVPNVPQASLGPLQAFVTRVETMRHHSKSRRASDLVHQFLQDVQYGTELRRTYSDEVEREMRQKNVDEVITRSAAYEDRTRSRDLGGFLNDLALRLRDQNDEKEKKLDRNAVFLMTLHAAKGLEFPQVYLVGLEEGILPHYRSIGEAHDYSDEERRLCYVGITRAQRRLTMTFAENRRRRGRLRPSEPSRFLIEIAGDAVSPKPTVAQGPGSKHDNSVRPAAKPGKRRGRVQHNSAQENRPLRNEVPPLIIYRLPRHKYVGFSRPD